MLRGARGWVGERGRGLSQSAGVILGFMFGEELYETGSRNGLAGTEVRTS